MSSEIELSGLGALVVGVAEDALALVVEVVEAQAGLHTSTRARAGSVCARAWMDGALEGSATLGPFGGGGSVGGRLTQSFSMSSWLQ